jgi:hypothetical protein
MRKDVRRGYLTITGLFVVLSLLVTVAKDFLKEHGFNTTVLYVANLILFLITIAGFLLQQFALRSANPQVFIRSVYGTMMLKLFICMIAVFGYAFVLKEHLNKPALFTAMGFYVLYTVIEVSAMMKALRKNKNA